MGALAGKVAIITGAGSGIGRASAIRFAAEGAKVVLGDMAASVHDTAAMIGDAATAVQMDAGDEADVAAIVAKAIELHGHLDIAFANAGISGGMEGIFDNTVENFNSVLRVNLIGPWLMVKHAGKAMADAGNGGSIILTASVAGIRSGAGGPPYSASKAGAIHLTRALGDAWAGRGIRVNGIAPGLIATKMTEVTTSDPVRLQERLKGIPLNRLGRPEEIAGVALFLASPLAAYIVGETIVVDGGRTLS